jgi:hypothetical protein
MELFLETCPDRSLFSRHQGLFPANLLPLRSGASGTRQSGEDRRGRLQLLERMNSNSSPICSLGRHGLLISVIETNTDVAYAPLASAGPATADVSFSARSWASDGVPLKVRFGPKRDVPMLREREIPSRAKCGNPHRAAPLKGAKQNQIAGPKNKTQSTLSKIVASVQPCTAVWRFRSAGLPLQPIHFAAARGPRSFRASTRLLRISSCRSD